MKRLIPLLAAVFALALSGTAAADTFRVVHPNASGGGVSASFSSSGGPAVAFTQNEGGPMTFEALRGIWQAAGNAYGIPWQVLAAINKVETDFGQNLGPSSAGAVGWMQFMPSTWARWGIDANGDGRADPNNPTDAIFSAARYLAGCGGQLDITRAVYCYNHATWYVNDVMGLASLYGRGGGTAFSGAGTTFSVGDLQPQIATARTKLATSKTQVATARAQARTLAHVERRFLRVAGTAHLLSDQLEANKRAALIGARRDAADSRVARLQRQLRSATTLLGRLRDEQSRAAVPGFVFPGGGFANGQSNRAVSIAFQYLGIPYKWAGATPTGGFDCSGLVQYVYAQLGVSLPHNAAAQWSSPQAVSVPKNELQPGDLVFFDGLDHVGIYIGGGDFIDAPHTGSYVRIDSLTGWYAARYDGAKRIVGASGAADTFQTSSSGTSFSSDVVYFTH
jgi:cell wall-associated NlpC family hydrolase